MNQNPRSIHAANDSQQHSSGLCLANAVASSDLLIRSWAAISDLQSQDPINEQPPSPLYLKHKVYRQSPDSVPIVAFVTEPECTVDHLQEHREAVLVSPAYQELPPLFDFLYSKKAPSFFIYKAAIDIFISHKDKLLELKTQIGKSPSLIITGHSLGGAVASLFTLWLFDGMDLSKSKRPLCITFGSPLIGDDTLRKAILQNPALNSCFLHLVYYLDPVPRLLFDGGNAYQPFGTFVICSESGCSSFEEPESVKELMVAAGKYSDQGLRSTPYSYGEIAGKLKRKAICKNITPLGDSTTDQLQAWLLTQLQSIGLLSTMQQQGGNDSDAPMTKIKKSNERFYELKKVYDPSKKLNDSKIQMAQLEWYKKVCKNLDVGYYDCYRRGRQPMDVDAITVEKKLVGYWTEEVKKADSRPQKEDAYLRTRWLLGGTNYRRMVEPLEIAEYYKSGRRDYCNQGRSDHFIKLEDWLNQTKQPRNDASNEKLGDVAAILTEDSCFWAHVEEALISCETLTSQGTGEAEKICQKGKLEVFENYVLGLIMNRKLSSEIFLKDSSFMQWWRHYEAIMGRSYSSAFTGFMRNLATRSAAESESFCTLYERGEV